MRGVPLLCAAAYAGSALVLPLLGQRSSRIAAAERLGLEAAGPAGLAIVLVPAFAAAALALGGGTGGLRARAARAFESAAALLSFPLLLLLAALGASLASAPAPAVARISLGAGFWLASAFSYCLVLAAGRRDRRLPFLAALCAAGGIVAFGAAGLLDGLSLAREFAGRRAAFLEALLRHAAYGLLPTLAAAFVAIPLVAASRRVPALGAFVFAAASVAQTVPTLALLGLLIVPLALLARAVPALAALGFRGVGWAPSAVVLFLYALLPLASAARAGLSAVSPESLEAGRALGMSRRQLLTRVELPLAAPWLMSGLRTAVAQNMGNATLAGLVGSGGLGGLLFLGLAQAAPDLALLAALPISAMALGADRLLGALETALAAAAGGGER